MRIFWRMRESAGSLERGGKCLMIIRTLHEYEPRKGRENEADQSAYLGKPVL
jgi:hypothetical protein